MNKLIKKSCLLFVAILFAFGCHQEQKQEKVKYVFFFIGDGMGLAQRTLTEMYLASLNDSIGQCRLLMNDFPVQGLATTYSLNSYITCSAASGTALATGKKTNNGIIGFSPDTIPYQTIAEAAKKGGKSVGILTNVMLNHATPAAFSTHATSRSFLEEIRKDQLASEFDYFAGGYMSIEDPVNQSDKDAFALQATEAGYTVLNMRQDIKNIPSYEKIILFADTTESGGSMLYAIDRPENSMQLLQMFRMGVEKLSVNPNGFFMMLESGKIDWAAHNNDPATIVHEMVEFDDIIRVAFEFYKNRPDETLIVVTADHETGGLALGNSAMRYKMKPQLLQHQKGSAHYIADQYKLLIQDISSRSTTSEIPFQFVSTWFGLGNKDTPLLRRDSALLREAWEKDINSEEQSVYLVTEAKKLLSQKAGVGWTTSQHTGIPVPVSAVGVGADRFNGYYDNTDIPKRMAELMELQLN